MGGRGCILRRVWGLCAARGWGSPRGRWRWRWRGWVRAATQHSNRIARGLAKEESTERPWCAAQPVAHRASHSTLVGRTYTDGTCPVRKSCCPAPPHSSTVRSAGTFYSRIYVPYDAVEPGEQQGLVEWAGRGKGEGGRSVNCASMTFLMKNG